MDIKEEKLNHLLVGSIFRSMNFLRVNLDTLFSKYGLVSTEFRIMLAIHKSGPQPVQALTKRILLTSGGMTYAKKQLIQKGFLEEHICDRDKRVFYIHLTPKGEELLQIALKDFDECLDKIFKDLTDEDKRSLLNILKKIGV